MSELKSTADAGVIEFDFQAQFLVQRLKWIWIAVLFLGILSACVFQYLQHRREQRALKVHLLVTEARMAISIPDLGDSEALRLLSLKSPHDAIKLCTEAISLAPDSKVAYEVRALAYQRIGEAELAKRDQNKAASLK